MEYEIVVADRFSLGGGGKGILSQFFQLLLGHGALIERSGPYPKLTVFFMDRDADDIFRKLKTSAHVVYTLYNSVENHVFREGDLQGSIAVAASIDVRAIQNQIPNPDAWRLQCARTWRDWIGLCLTAKKLRLTHPASFSKQASAINGPADAPTDPVSLANCIAGMQALARVPRPSFDRTIAASRRLTDSLFRQLRHDLIFKGKWYTSFAIRDAEIAAGGPAFNRRGFEDRLIGALIATIDFDGGWAEHFRAPLRTAIAMI